MHVPRNFYDIKKISKKALDAIGKRAIMVGSKLQISLLLRRKIIQMQFNIEKNVPLTQRKTRNTRGKAEKHKWPLKSMEVGDSIFVPVTEFSSNIQNGHDYITHASSSQIYNICKRYSLKNRNFTSREVREGKKLTGVRIWRTE